MKFLLAAILFCCSFTAYCQQYWLPVSSPVIRTINRSIFIDSVYGWAAGDSGVIIHTSNSGANWVKQVSGIGNTNIDDIFFINQTTGWALANDYYYTGTIVLKTSDGGANWLNYRYPDTTIVFNAIHFLDSVTGYISGYSGVIYKTTNGGAQWFSCIVDTAFCQYLYLFPKNKFYFQDQNTGYVCGGQVDIQGMVWRTTNGGSHWYTYCISAEPLYDVKALNEFKVQSVGGDYEYGFSNVLSYNSGDDWHYEFTGITGRGFAIAYRTPAEVWVPLNFTASFAVNTDSAAIGSKWIEIPVEGTTKINSAVFVTPTFGWAFGGEGKIYKYNNTLIGISGNNESVPEAFSLSQNFPNPFNPVTVINYTLNRSGLVKAVIYDINGREVSTQLNTYQQQGFHSAEWNASSMPSGVYFLNMQMNGFSKSIKMLLVK